MYVNLLDRPDKKTFGIKGPLKKVYINKSYLSDKLIKKLNFENSNHQSISFPSHWLKFINSSSADVIHLHWINSEMLSISDIGKIKKPVFGQVMICAFFGAEHLSKDDRWQTGYEKLVKLFENSLI